MAHEERKTADPVLDALEVFEEESKKQHGDYDRQTILRRLDLSSDEVDVEHSSFNSVMVCALKHYINRCIDAIAHHAANYAAEIIVTNKGYIMTFNKHVDDLLQGIRMLQAMSSQSKLERDLERVKKTRVIDQTMHLVRWTLGTGVLPPQLNFFANRERTIRMQLTKAKWIIGPVDSLADIMWMQHDAYKTEVASRTKTIQGAIQKYLIHVTRIRIVPEHDEDFSRMLIDKGLKLYTRKDFLKEFIRDTRAFQNRPSFDQRKRIFRIQADLNLFLNCFDQYLETLERYGQYQDWFLTMEKVVQEFYSKRMSDEQIRLANAPVPSGMNFSSRYRTVYARDPDLSPVT